jgi:hypothetical protein
MNQLFRSKSGELFISTRNYLITDTSKQLLGDSSLTEKSASFFGTGDLQGNVESLGLDFDVLVLEMCD